MGEPPKPPDGDEFYGFLSGPEDLPFMPPRVRDRSGEGPPADRSLFDAALNHAATERISFSHAGVEVCAQRLRCVGRKVKFIEGNATSNGSRASYYPHTDTARIPGLVPTRYASQPSRAKREIDSHAIHEMVHALQDEARVSLPLWEAEGAAYLAQAVYLHHRRLAEDPTSPVEHQLVHPVRVELIQTADRVAHALGLFAGGRVVVSSNDLRPFIEPLTKVPGLSGAAVMGVRGGNNGLPGGPCTCGG